MRVKKTRSFPIVAYIALLSVLHGFIFDEIVDAITFRRLPLQTVKGTFQPGDIPVHDMQVHLGGFEIRMSQKFLEHPGIHAVLQHVGREAVSQSMASHPFIDSSPNGCLNLGLPSMIYMILFHYPETCK